MHPRFHGSFFSSSSGFLGPSFDISCPNQELAHGGGRHLPDATNSTSSDNGAEDPCFSDTVFRYIDQMLMEEETEEKVHMLQESLDFQAKERSFYEILGQKYPPSPQKPNPTWLDPCANSKPGSDSSSNGAVGSVPGSQSWDMIQAVWKFRKGLVDASKFLPRENADALDKGMFDDQNPEEERANPTSLGKKKKNQNDLEAQKRENKIPAIYGGDGDIPVEEFDNLLLYTRGKSEQEFNSYREILRNGECNNAQPNEEPRRSRKKKNTKKKRKEAVDLRSLLIGCAQSIAADDRATATELLDHIRCHATPHGDSDQRLAHYFLNGLEARLTGTGSEARKSLLGKPTKASDFLRAYYTYLASSPFGKISNFVSCKLIHFKSEQASRVHVIDLGIMYGFQWPTFIQRLAEREGGPPKLRITGVDFPQPGFWPAERVEETGRRLAHYAEMFGVPFEYRAIAQKWESIRAEDLGIEEGEYVAVSCMYRAGNLADEGPRDMVLGLVGRIRPDVFVHGVVNGAYGVPFYVTRFREALFHFSSIFDMLETSIPREKPERVVLEREIFGKEIMNVIACEGWERVERPETYKQWHVRHMRAGLEQVAFDRKLVDSAVSKLRSYYHKDFVGYEDNQWLLMGWKGRILYAISCWKSA